MAQKPWGIAETFLETDFQVWIDHTVELFVLHLSDVLEVLATLEPIYKSSTSKYFYNKQ